MDMIAMMTTMPLAKPPIWPHRRIRSTLMLSCLQGGLLTDFERNALLHQLPHRPALEPCRLEHTLPNRFLRRLAEGRVTRLHHLEGVRLRMSGRVDHVLEIHRA